MKEYHGMHLGLCISNNDPQKRGRVQIFIPHIMPALYKDWNKNGEDITLDCVGDNLPNGLTSEVINELNKILPWAESASPIMGSSSPGTLTSSFIEGVSQGISSVAAGAVNLTKKLFKQDPEAAPPIANKDSAAIAANAAKFGPITAAQLQTEGKYTHKCGQGARQMIGGMTNNSYFKQGLSAGSGGSSYAGSLSQGNDYLQKSGMYQQPASIPSDYKPQKGDVVTGTKSGQPGHIQVYDGTAWVSDTRQKGILTNYGNLTLHRMNDKGLAAIGENANNNIDASTTVNEQNSISGTVAAPSPHQAADPTGSLEESNYGTIANPNVPTSSLTIANPGSQVSIGGGAIPVTTYSVGKSAGGTDETQDKWTNSGYTSTGKNLTPGCVAVNTSVYPLGTVFKDKATGQSFIATDKHGNSNPNVVDRYVPPSQYKGQSGTMDLEVVGQIPKSEIPTTVEGLQQKLAQYGTVPPGESASAFLGGVNAGVTDGLAIGDQTAPKLINNTDPHGPTVTHDVNNRAKGLFSYPSPGALLWVFFREGNPLFPVYFAANYGQDEWKSAYGYSVNSPATPAPGYQPEATADNPATSQGGQMMFEGGVGLKWENTDHPEDHTQSQKSIMLFGEDGSNMFMGTGYHQIFSKFDRRDQVEGDRWNTTLGFKEEWVQGDDNKVVMGDMLIKVGNVSQTAVDAVTKIQEYIKEIHKSQTESS